MSKVFEVVNVRSFETVCAPDVAVIFSAESPERDELTVRFALAPAPEPTFKDVLSNFAVTVADAVTARLTAPENAFKGATVTTVDFAS
jgi:hypothetical protein